MTPETSAHVQQLAARDAQLRLAIKNWKRKQRRAIAAAEQAIKNARTPSTHLSSMQRARDTIAKVMGVYGSHERFPVLLGLLEQAPDKLFWHAFLTEWSRCDVTSHYHEPRFFAAQSACFL